MFDKESFIMCNCKSPAVKPTSVKQVVKKARPATKSKTSNTKTVARKVSYRRPI